MFFSKSKESQQDPGIAQNEGNACTKIVVDIVAFLSNKVNNGLKAFTLFNQHVYRNITCVCRTYIELLYSICALVGMFLKLSKVFRFLEQK